MGEGTYIKASIANRTKCTLKGKDWNAKWGKKVDGLYDVKPQKEVLAFEFSGREQSPSGTQGSCEYEIYDEHGKDTDSYLNITWDIPLPFYKSNSFNAVISGKQSQELECKLHDKGSNEVEVIITVEYKLKT